MAPGLCVLKSSSCSHTCCMILMFSCLKQNGLSIRRTTMPKFLIHAFINLYWAPIYYVCRMLLGLGLAQMTQIQILCWSCSQFRTCSSDEVYLQFRNLWYWRVLQVVWSGESSQKWNIWAVLKDESPFSGQMRGKGNSRWGKCQCQGLGTERSVSLQHFGSLSVAWLKHSEGCVRGGKPGKMGAPASRSIDFLKTTAGSYGQGSRLCACRISVLNLVAGIWVLINY